MILGSSWNDENSTHEYTCHRRSQGCTSKVVRQLLIDVFKHGYITGFIYNMSNLIIVYGGRSFHFLLIFMTMFLLKLQQWLNEKF